MTNIGVNYKYCEKDYARLVYEKGFQTKHIPTELKLVILHLRDEVGVERAELKQALIDFCATHEESFNLAIWYRRINDAVKYGTDKKNRLINVDEILVTEGEAAYIDALPVEHDYKKLLFTFLVQMKLNKAVYEFKNQSEYSSTFFKGGMKRYNEIKKMANVPTKLDINAGFVRDMAEAGYISIYYNGLIKHNWLDECNESRDAVIRVKDYENVGIYWDYYKGVNGVRLCKECQQPFKVSPQCKLYCKKHKEYYKPLEQKTIRCIDCGVEFIAPPKANNQKRCTQCQDRYRKEYINSRRNVQIK